VPPLGRSHIESVLGRFIGHGQQVPPMYSALKQAGRPLYRLAREGVTVARAPRTIEVSRLNLLALEREAIELEVLCSKGTYVRVLAEDIAAALGTLGHVHVLRREYVEPFAGEPMHTLESLESACTGGQLPPLLPIDRPLAHLPAVQLEPAKARRLCQGQPVAAPDGPIGARVRLYEGETFLGIGETDLAGAVRPRRLLRLESRADG
jgi:tRNA pseudouridine55 synthase